MINLVLNKNNENKKRAIYAFYYLLKRYDENLTVSYKADNKSINIFYGIKPEEEKGLYIPYENYISRDFGISNYDGLSYLSPNDSGSPYYMENGIVTFNFDILFLSFYLLTCSEEYENLKRDDKNRFLAEYSQRKDYITNPFFDINSELIYMAMKVIDKSIERPKKSFCVLLTHDVDSVSSQNIYVFLHNLKELIANKDKRLNKKINTIIMDLLTNRHKQIDNYIGIETEYEAKSEFYFITGKKHRLGKRYKLSSISKQVKKLKDSSNHIIGLHTNFFSYDDEEKIRNEIKEIEDFAGVNVKSCRNHYLRFSVPSTWHTLENAGISYDTTIGYSDKNGFRAATVQGFLPYDINNDSIINIYEVPLAVMDGIIMTENISFDEKWIKIKKIVDECIRFNGTISILWHDYVIAEEDYKKMYIQILKYITSKNGSFILTDDLKGIKEDEQNELISLFNLID